MLQVNNVRICYGEVPAVHEISLEVRQGEVVSVIGANGAGKTTLMRAVSGLLPVRSGEIIFEGRAIHNLPAHRIVELGISHVPEGRLLFDSLTVRDNLLLGAYTRGDESGMAPTLEQVYSIFPILRERASQRAGTLSGGQQQMLAIARGLMSRPKLLILDEPSLGLAPALVSDLFATIQHIREQGLTIILVEQNVRDSLELADRAYLLQTGRVVMSGGGSDLLATDLVRKAYLGM
jgi:branched-chain amino acid transport system ATP-binding protein